MITVLAQGLAVINPVEVTKKILFLASEKVAMENFNWSGKYNPLQKQENMKI